MKKRLGIGSPSKYEFECPICESQTDAFLPFGVRPRPNRQCPVCKSLERHRLVWLYFREMTNLFKDNLKMLHIAPEPQISKVLNGRPNLDYISADISPGRAHVQMDITDIKYPDNSFDVIYASHVLEHIPDDRKAIGELYRVLKPNGWAILLVPILGERTIEIPNLTTPEEREMYYGQHDHFRKYGWDGVYKERLEGAGFVVKVDQYAKMLDPGDIKRYGLLEREDIYYCEKE